MVILDSDHNAAYVPARLEGYHALVTTGCYLVVEDTDINAYPVHPRRGAGPWRPCGICATSDECPPSR
jgi:cephalosporin hydroxylase